MDDLLNFSGSVKELTIYRAPITRGTFSEKQGKKSLLLQANYNEELEISSINQENIMTNFVYHEGNLICKHVADIEKNPLYKIDYFYEDDRLIKKCKTTSAGITEDSETFFYNSAGELIEKQSKTMKYEYIYENGLLIEERWHSEFSLNQIIRYRYKNGLLMETAHFSGEDIPGRKVILERESHGFITEETTFSPSGIIISHIKFNYNTIFKDNWLKRTKYILHSQNRKKEAIEVIYRDFKFYENLEEQEDPTPEEAPLEEPQDPVSELHFDNGLYKGEILDGEMHGEGEFIFNSGTKYKGYFQYNRMHGKGQLTYINGKVYEGTFENNVLEGPGACKWENGDFYVGEFKSGKMHGRGCYIWENGNRFEGLFENNQRTDQGILYKASELESTAPPLWVNELFK